MFKKVYLFLCLFGFSNVIYIHAATILPSAYAVNMDSNKTKTILWKINKKGMKHPAYLIGTCHAVGKSFLDSLPTIKSVLNNSNCLLTEIFPEPQLDTSKSGGDLKALPLLNKEDYKLLDSFFRATSGETEGLANEDVKNISMRDFTSGIIEMLLRKKGTVEFKQMDLELYKSFSSLSKLTFPLEYEQDLYYDKSDSVRAINVLNFWINVVRNPVSWDLADSGSALSKFIKMYKSMDLDYQLNDPEPAGISQSMSKDIYVRNKKWIPKIEENIKQNNTVIAVGLLHLYYSTGVISLLRADGYSVEPVLL